MMQAASDIFLGWTKGRDANQYLYGAAFYAQLCGRTLARTHARSGDSIAIAGYLGKGDGFDRSIVDFSERYADQNERDYRTFRERSGPAGWQPWKGFDAERSDRRLSSRRDDAPDLRACCNDGVRGKRQALKARGKPLHGQHEETEYVIDRRRGWDAG
jgi:Uncharacterized protein conserved in bacteria (DUF2252)